MLKLTICILVVAVVWDSTSAKNIDAEAGYCNIGGLKVKEGETVPAPIGKCQKYSCKSAEPQKYTSLTCSMWQLEPGSKCHKSEKDLTKPYPECCPKKVCPEE